ncbi:MULTISPECIES: AAA family ATPase [unclassified Mycobacterium]|uniref:AAA family ATPase n=1 Tax=unclassified Mycobacterium TaxID=2642494 RepID=UPI0029C6EEF6|nr:MULTISPECIES: adenylate/guanylate cyclase domain-containing protein [unclassified Mycobacterium]
MTAAAACGSCGTALREHARFCDECGAPTAASADTAQYKQVTVLFADVVRSMDIAAAVDIERLRDIMTELVERLAAVAQRYGGTVEYNGDGVMALFGAPIALENHAFRGCLAALAIQAEANRLAADVKRRDGVELQLRVGLNSGRVIVGELGSGALGYAATGATVGFAQRMESVAPPGGVMLSEATARLVERTVTLSEPQWVRIKGADEPVCARQLLAIRPPEEQTGRAEASLVGRRWEMAALDAIVDRTNRGRGGVVNIVGPPGIGKSRAAREAAALAAGRGVEVFWAFCESHTGDVPFHLVAQLIRAATGVSDLDGDAARARVRAAMRDADPEDLLLLDDLLGIADPGVPLPQIDPNARRRRLTALLNTAALTRTTPALYIVEDAHWIDVVSESMLADLLTVIPRTTSMVLITARPEYEGALTRVSGAQSIALAPLADSESAALLGDLVGAHPSVGELAAKIADRAAGNPFFAEEMVRELVQRGVLTGKRGNYLCRADVADLDVPATVQAAIAARIDRLNTPARRALNAASVIGVRFGAELLAALEIDPAFDELLNAELIDQVRFTPSAEYAFRHPLIHAVAYESQLKSDRSEWHRRLSAAIEARDPGSVDDNAALIAEHLRAAGELHAAYGWHMRAGAWSTNRDVAAARLSWERACRIADALPDHDPTQLSMRIAPRTMLCVTDWLSRPVQASWGRFAEFRELCSAAGDKVSLAIGMTGLASELLYAGNPGEGSRLASEQMALLDSIGDASLTVGLSFVAFANWFNSGDFSEILLWSQSVIDLAAGDPTKGADFGIGSPLAIATAFRGIARWWLGIPGWREDLDDALAMSRVGGATTLALVVAWVYLALTNGVLRIDDTVMHTAEEAFRVATDSSSNFAVIGAQLTLAIALLHRDDADDRRRGLDLMTQTRDRDLPDSAPSLVPLAQVWVAREQARSGDRDAAITAIREAEKELHQAGRVGWAVGVTDILVETLLARGTEVDLAEAREVIDQLAKPPYDGSAIQEITLLRLRTLLARAEGDDVAYRDFAIRYRAMAHSLGFEGHIDWTEAMTAT